MKKVHDFFGGKICYDTAYNRWRKQYRKSLRFICPISSTLAQDVQKQFQTK